jgi:cytochrome c2
VKRGELVFEQVGCRACHSTQPDDAYPGPRDVRNADDKYRAAEGTSHYMSEFGPNLSGMGSKTDKKWLYAWLRDPKHYFPQTRMGSFRLTEQEAADVVEFLMSLRKPAFEQAPGLSAPDDGLVDALIYEQLKAKMPDVDALAEMKPWGRDYKVWWLGRKMVQNYSCYSCHELTDETQADEKGVKKFKEIVRKDGPTERRVIANNWLDMDGIGVELTGAQPWGQKGVDKLAFNFAEFEPPNYNGVSFTHPITKQPYQQVGTKENDGVVRVHKTRHDFFHAKMLNPRVFDGGRSESTPPDELLRMPNFYLTPEEATSLATFVLSFKDAESTGLVERAKKRLSPDEVAIARGQRLVREANCRGCHRLELDKFKVEWTRLENDKRVTTPVWVEGRVKREAPAAEMKATFERVGLKVGRGARLVTVDWTTDGSSMEKPVLLAGVLPQIAFDGVGWWLLKGEERHPIIVNRPQDGGDILEHIRAFKRKTGSEYWIDVTDPGAFESRFPPHLRSQGVKTQSEWFYAFLKEPYPIRPNLNPMLPDLSGIAEPSAELRARVKAEIPKLSDPDGDDDELLEPLKKLGREALPAIRDEYLGAKDPVTRWRLMLVMRVSAHPDVSVRMPTFGFSDEEASSIARYFWVRDQKRGVDIYPHTAFPERDRHYLEQRQGAIADAVKNVIKDCVACHVYDGKVPPLDDAKGSNKIAPDFNQMETRLRGRWLYEWLREPGVVYPSTTMTAYTYDPDDRRKATVEFILNFQKYKSLKN